jgi:hypothetical protein
MSRRYFTILICSFVFVGCFTLSRASLTKVALGQPYFQFKMVFNPKLYKHPPSFAFWIEDPETGDVETLFVTKKAGLKKWFGAKADARPYALPVWFGVEKKQKKEDVQAVTDATPKGARGELECVIPQKFMNKKVNVYLEINASFDFNEYYPKKDKKGEIGFSEANGQPSLVWATSLQTNAETQKCIKPQLLGTGALLGQSHEVNPDLTRISTAKQMIQNMEWSYYPTKQ